MNYSKCWKKKRGTKGIRVKPEFAEAESLISNREHFVIASHVRPDGDAVGSLLALARSLRLQGKQTIPVLAEGIPPEFDFLPDVGEVRTKPPHKFEALIAVDVTDIERLGEYFVELNRQPELNIDHHPTNAHFADVNIVDPTAAATAEILFDFMRALDLPMDVSVATQLMLGLVTDTIGFRTPNVTAKTFTVAAKLIELGAPLAELYERALNRRSFIAARYWGHGLSQLEQHDGVVLATLTLEDRRAAGYPGKDDSNLINLVSTIEEARIAILLVEQEGGKVKISWRSRGEANVADIATSFGGGGHFQAAGAIILGDVESVKMKVLSASLAALDGALELGR